MATWAEYNKQMSGGQTDDTSYLKNWGAFNTQMAQRAFGAEASSQQGINAGLFKSLRSRGTPTSEINQMGLRPEKISYPKTFLETTKKTFGGLFDQMLRNIRGTSQVLATPIAGALALPKEGVSPKEAMKESLNMAKEVMTNKNVSIDAGVEEAAQMWLKNRGVGKFGGRNPDVADVAALSMLGFFNMFGDPLFEFGAGLRGARAIKEFAQFKKVGQITKEFKEGTTLLKGTGIKREIRLTNDLKIKVEPKTNEIVIKGYKKRFPSQKAMPEGELSPETTNLILDTREALGSELTAKFQGDDLILKPKPTLAEQIAKPTEPLLQEATKYKSAEEFVNSQQKVFRGGEKIEPSKITKYGISISKSLQVAKKFGKDKTTQEFFIDSNAKIATDADIPNIAKLAFPNAEPQLAKEALMLHLGLDTKPTPELLKLFRDAGFDAVDLSKISPIYAENEIRVLNSNVLKTKSQLTDFYNQAVKGVKEVKPITTEIPKISQELKPVITETISESIIKKSKLGIGVEAKAIEKKLIEGLKDLPEYQQVNMKEQAQLATDLLRSDREKSLRIAFGKEVPPANILPESIFTAVEEQALKTGDIDTITKLARSNLVSEATAMGQRIRALAERNPNSPTKIIRELEELKAKRFKGEKAKQLTEEQKKIQRELKAMKKSEEDLNNFINSIIC